MTTSYQPASTARESTEALYIKTCGERLEETIAGTWMDVGNPLNLIRDKDRFTALQADLEAALLKHLTELERAEWASMLCGGSDYESWLADQE